MTSQYKAFYPRPLSLFERKELSAKLKQEAQEKLDEAARIDAGIESDEAAMVDVMTKALAKIGGGK